MSPLPLPTSDFFSSEVMSCQLVSELAWRRAGPSSSSTMRPACVPQLRSLAQRCGVLAASRRPEQQLGRLTPVLRAPARP